MLKSELRTLYCELLGQSIKQELINQEIPQNEVSYYFNDEIRLISAPAISQILKGKRNLTLDTAEALQETLGLPNVKRVFFPSHGFCELLIIQLTELMLTCGFNSTKELFQIKELDIQQNLSILASALYEFFPDFPEEEASYQIADSLAVWLIEFVALVAQI
ncbi:XRE family transcriptional regulator [Streptococcus uberis]|uniref:helix-turn-helix domain-containing protein n=1 Tax=Streptococcus uberis TaxID=1349 RepID=UPI000544128E|nr:helix-turn-helix transcriptional regulator [Streptococcus uberis]KHD40478.1 XRE family transcriptional regulator [Streptococcus hongkongensis]KKF41188.1 XRE family transcriptional regulator [Streptococcus uberis EF20/0145]SQG47015.1 Uncharacterised protein [Streptococcus uberis]